MARHLADALPAAPHLLKRPLGRETLGIKGWGRGWVRNGRRGQGPSQISNTNTMRVQEVGAVENQQLHDSQRLDAGLTREPVVSSVFT